MRSQRSEVKKTMWFGLLLATMTFVRPAAASQGGFTISAANQTITQGRLGSSAITVTPLNGYTGNITFTVAGATPAFTNGCVLFANYANVSGINPTTVGSLTIATRNLDCPPNAIGNPIGGTTIGEVRRGNLLERSRGSGPLGVAMGGVLLMGLLSRRSRKLPRLACLLVLVALGAFVAGCSVSAPMLTPKGSYTMTLQGTDKAATPNISASTTFTVVIQ